MGRKLSEKENLENVNAIMAFSQGEYEVETNILIMKEDQILDSFKNIKVYVGNHLIYMDISITWEDFYTTRYREEGLSGVYSTGYYLFNYSEEGQYLGIRSNDSDKVIILNKL